MRPKGLTQAEIERIANFDWDDSADDEIEEEQDQNMEEIIEETLKNLDNRAENEEVGLIDQIIGSKDVEDVKDLNENEIVAQEVMEKIDFNSLKWSSAEFMECETAWKSKLCSNAVKKPIEYFGTFFTDELWLLYRRDIAHTDGESKYMPLINFQLDVAAELLNASQTTAVAKKRGRPSSLLLTMNSGTAPSSPASPAPSSPVASTGSESNPYKRAYVEDPPKSLRLDGYNHWPEWGTRGRCRVCTTGFPSCKCSKCNVHLCSNPQKNCFVSYHT